MPPGLDDPTTAVPWVLLHGTPLGPRVWDDVAADLSRSAPVWAPDLTPTVDDPTPQRSLAVGLAAQLREPAHLVGHSFGGQIALELALIAPRVVES
ncbi:MAG: alpha/beta fold hydrolase, partial [Gordonia paraffinivorans]